MAQIGIEATIEGLQKGRFGVGQMCGGRKAVAGNPRGACCGKLWNSINLDGQRGGFGLEIGQSQ